MVLRSALQTIVSASNLDCESGHHLKSFLESLKEGNHGISSEAFRVLDSRNRKAVSTILSASKSSLKRELEILF